MPKVSVIVPIYNVEKYLQQCLESIINQTLQDIEIICINDGSTDLSSKILESYRIKDNRIKIINNDNTGYGNSMNIGLDVAIGEYIGIVESDDFINNNMFENLYKLAKENDADIVKSDWYDYTAKTNLSRKKDELKKYKTNILTNIKKQPSLIKIQPSVWAGIYKNKFIKQQNIRFLETLGASYQDTSFSFKAFSLADKIFLTNEAYLYYRQDNPDSSVKSKEKVYMVCHEYQEIDKFLKQNSEIKKFINSYKLIKQFKAYLWNAKKIHKSYRKSFLQRFSNTFKKYYENGEFDKIFYSEIPEDKMLLLINDTNQFEKYLKNEILKQKLKNTRRKICSIHINCSKIEIVIWGKQIVNIG